MTTPRSLLAATGLAFLAHTAAAADNTRIEWQVSTDNTNWSSSIDAASGQTIYCRAVVSYIPGSNGTSAPLGLASFVFQPTVANWDLAGSGPSIDTLLPFVNGGRGSNTSTPVGVVTNANDPTQFGRMSPWGRTTLSSTSFLHGFTHSNPDGDGINYLRIAQAQVTGWISGPGNTTGGSGVPLSQLSDVGRTVADPAFNPNTTGVVAFKFGVTLSADPDNRTLVIGTRTSAFGNRNAATGEREIYWYNSLTESNGSIRGTPTVTPAQVIVNGVITQHPTSLTVEAGQTAQFTVAAQGSNLQYQWRRNTVPLVNGGHVSGAQSPTLTIQPAEAADAGDYDVIATNSLATQTSLPASLTVTCPAPHITLQPHPLRVNPCHTAVLHIDLDPPFYPFTYQWRRNGLNLSNSSRISGVNTPTLTISPIGFFLAGTYDVLMTNTCGSAASQPVFVEIADPGDFNGDGDTGTDADIVAFFACLAGSCCDACLGSDFNGDGDFGTDADISAFFRALAGGGC